MSSNKSFWDSLGDTISFILFIKYGLPILIVLIIGLVIKEYMVQKWIKNMQISLM